MRAFQLLAPLLLVGFDVADADKYLWAGERLSPGETLTTTSSCNGQELWLTFQTDGNLVYYTRDYDGVVSVIWSSDTVAQNSADVDAAVMQTDGNFVVYEKGGVAKWDSGTYPNTDGVSNYFIMHDDGTLSIRSPGHNAVPAVVKWTAGTACIPPTFPGCFDGWLETYAHQILPGDSNDACISTCRGGRYVYAGIYQGTRCHCGNLPMPLRQVPDADCTYHCHDSHGHPCGGPSVSSVWFVWGGGLALSTSKTKED